MDIGGHFYETGVGSGDLEGTLRGSSPGCFVRPVTDTLETGLPFEQLSRTATLEHSVGSTAFRGPPVGVGLAGPAPGVVAPDEHLRAGERCARRLPRFSRASGPRA